MNRVNRSNRKFNRSQRRPYQDNDDDVVNIDWAKPLNQIAHEILQHLIRVDNLPKSQLLAYLNCFTKYCLKRSKEKSSANGSQHGSFDALVNNIEEEIVDKETSVKFEAYTDIEVLSCLRPCLLNEGNEVRAASLRAIRYYVTSKKALRCLLELNLHHLIARSLDIVLENRIERVQSLRLIRHMLTIDPTVFPLALARCLCAVGADNSLEKDMLLRATWATIAEVTVLVPAVSARSGCIGVMTRCALNSAICTTSNAAGGDHGLGGRGGGEHRDHRGHMNNVTTGGTVIGGTLTTLTLPYGNIAISEAILSSFLHLYNWPHTRRLLQPKGSDLFYFISPFTDTYSFLLSSNAARNNMNPFNFEMIDQLEAEENQQAIEQKEAKGGVPMQGPTAGHNRLAANKHQQLQQQAQSNFEFRTLRYLACKNALLSCMRSWPGMFFMCRRFTHPEASHPLQPSESVDTTWDYSEIYRQTGEQNIRSLLDSLRFFGISDAGMPTKVTQMVSGIGKAMDNCSQASSFFTTTSYGTLNPLESLISIFHLPYPEVHRHLLELVFELFGIRPPDWMDSFDEALRCVYYSQVDKRSKSIKQSNIMTSFDVVGTSPTMKSYFPEEWQLYEGFVAKEAEQILPSRCSRRLNFISNYYALLLQAMVECGLLEALISLILDSHDQAPANLATILLGELIHLSGKYLPASNYAHRCQSLPTLVAASLSDCKGRRNRALTAITHLNEIHQLKKRHPKPASLYLEQQLYFCQGKDHPKPTVPHRKISFTSAKNNDDCVISLIKSTLVLKKGYFKEWNWDVITDILRNPGESLRKLEDKEHHRQFIRRLMDFFRPSRRLFSLISRNSSLLPSDLMQSSGHPSGFNGRAEPIYVENPRLLCIAATQLIDFLLGAEESRAAEFIEDFLIDLDLSFKNITTKSTSSDEVLLPSRLLSTLAHHYFLLIGRFTHCPVGRGWLEKTHLYQYLLDLISLASNDVYMKLIVSSLDYSDAPTTMCQTLLSKVLTATPDSSRIYATKYLRVLLRARAPYFSQWPIDFLVVQLYDRCQAVSLSALDILDEACAEDESCLEKVISHRPTVFHLGDSGITFFARFASHPCGLSYLKESNMLDAELTRWLTIFTSRYVRLVEDDLNECFSLHQRSDFGTFGFRSDKRNFPYSKRISTTTFVPPHLYGQLVQTEEGLSYLRDRLIVPPLVSLLRDHIAQLVGEPPSDNALAADGPTEATVLRVKAALWSIGHLATTEAGLGYVLDREEPIVQWICALAKCCPVLSLRATAFYVLSLFASTRKGCLVLGDFGWTGIQHSHQEMFPINQQEYDNFYYNGRPRFMSDPDKAGGRPADHHMVTISSPSFYMTGDDGPEPTVPSSIRHYSQSSSRSSSSSYLSMQANQTQGGEANSKVPTSSGAVEDHKPAFSLSSSSSSTSISNTSSIGCLAMTSILPTTSYSRPRSSSDCVPTLTSSSNATIGSKLVDAKVYSSKPDGQDSGILEVNSKLSLSKEQMLSGKLVPAARSRKISAPCFAPSTLEGCRETRSDSNDSSRTANTALYSSSGTGSRSTSFAEYSTSSSGSNMLDPPRNDRTVSFSPDSTTLEVDIDSVVAKDSSSRCSRRQVDRPQSRRQLSLLAQATDDPYPSPVDAHGYAQLRAIQKRRVQSLSGNMFFSSMGNSGVVDEPLNFEARPHSSSVKSDEMPPEIFITDPNASSCLSSTGGRVRKVSHVSLPATSPVDTDRFDLKRLLRIPSASSIEDHSGGGGGGSSFSKSVFNRSFSRVSRGSFVSVDSVGTMALDEVSLGDSVSTNTARNLEKAQFMCLALPDSLSLIFHISDETATIPRAKRVQFSSQVEQIRSTESEQNASQLLATPQPSGAPVRPCLSQQLSSSVVKGVPSNNEGLDLHTELKCLACCLKHKKTEHGSQIGSSGTRTPSQAASTFGQKKYFDFSEKLVSKFKTDLSQQLEACHGCEMSQLLSPHPSLMSSSIASSSFIQQRKEVLRLVSNLSAAMFAKQAEQGLLILKQRFPTVFEDICLYSEVCLQMETANYRAPARRFLHELFDEQLLSAQMYKDAERIVRRRNVPVTVTVSNASALPEVPNLLLPLPHP